MRQIIFTLVKYCHWIHMTCIHAAMFAQVYNIEVLGLENHPLTNDIVKPVKISVIYRTCSHISEGVGNDPNRR